MIDILMAAAITRLHAGRPHDLPTVSPGEVWRLATGLAALVLLTLMIMTGPEHAVGMGDGAPMATMADAVAQQTEVHGAITPAVLLRP